MNDGPVICNTGPLIALSLIRRFDLLAQLYERVVSAKRAGLLPSVRPLLEEMGRRGYFLSERLIERACTEAGE